MKLLVDTNYPTMEEILSAGEEPSKGNYAKTLTQEEFLKIEDRDLQCFIYASNQVCTAKREMKKIDNEDKLAYYDFHKTINKSTRGHFFPKSVLQSWISYDKKTKKVKISKNHQDVSRMFLKDYFHDIGLVHELTFNLTGTFCKRVIEGKISTIRDIVEYFRSYILRDKSLDIQHVYKFLLSGKLLILPIVEDPENAPDPSEFEHIHVHHTVATMRPFKFKIKDIPKLEKMYGKWYREQSEKFNSFK